MPDDSIDIGPEDLALTDQELLVLLHFAKDPSSAFSVTQLSDGAGLSDAAAQSVLDDLTAREHVYFDKGEYRVTPKAFHVISYLIKDMMGAE